MENFHIDYFYLVRSHRLKQHGPISPLVRRKLAVLFVFFFTSVHSWTSLGNQIQIVRISVYILLNHSALECRTQCLGTTPSHYNTRENNERKYPQS